MSNNRWKGIEFKPGEIALQHGKYESLVICWTKEYGGWWYIQNIESGLMGYTRSLTKK